MKYRTCLTTLLYSFLLGLILPASAQNSLQHQKDSLRHALEHAEGIDKLQTYNKLYYIYMAEAGDDQKMDTLMMLFEQAEAEAIRQGNTQMQGMVYGNRIISYINRNEHDKVIVNNKYKEKNEEDEHTNIYNVPVGSLGFGCLHRR